MSKTLTSVPSPKLFPWFVSDVTPTDFKNTITSLLSTTFFPEPLVPDTKTSAHLEQMVTRWRTYLEQGIFILSTDLTEVNGQKADGQAIAKFWTEPWPYWNMKERASQLWQWLHDSDLVVFKVCTFRVYSAIARPHTSLPG